MKQNKLKLLLSLLMLCCASTVLAHDFEVDGIYYNKNGTQATVTYRGTSSSQYNNEYTGSVTIPSTVTYGGTTYSVTAIGERAFISCNVISVTIPNSVLSIEKSAFEYCSLLTSVDIPNSVTTIGERAFALCRKLKNVSLGNSVTLINDEAFLSCTVMESVEIPNKVTAINRGVFYNCTGLTSVNIPNSVTSIGNNAFSRCTGLTSITIPYSVTSIGNYAFNQCTGLNSVDIPNSVTSIGNYAFYQCTGLNSVDIPNSVISIGNSAFGECSSLANVTIGTAVTSIGNYAFQSCTGLTSIKVENGNSIYDSRDNCNAIIETASNTLIAGCKNTTIPNTVTSIGSSAFSGCSGLTSITIPNSVTSIGNYAFLGCSGLTSVTIGSSSIGSGVFSDCTSLTNVTIASSVTSIGYPLFSGCDNLTSIKVESGNSVYDSRDNCNAIIETASNTLIAGCNNTIIPNTVTTIGSYSFRGFKSLTSIHIPNTVTAIGEGAFYDCRGLKSVNIPNSVISLGEIGTDSIFFSIGVFQYCTGLEQVSLGNSILTIGDRTFYGCSALTNVTIPNSVTTIGRGVFGNCTGLTSVTIPNSVTSIGEWAFSYCTGLTSVTIPNSVTSIGNAVFSDCSSLTSVRIPNSVTSIGDYAFSSCYGLTSVTIPSSVTSIGNYAFGGCSGLTKVICRADTPPVMGNSNVFDNSTYSSVTLYIPGESLQEYKTTDYWNMFTNILSLDEMQNDQFEVNGIFYYIIDDEAVVTYRGTSYSQYSNEYSGTVNIPSTVTHDGVTYPVTTIGENAFRYCSTLNSVIIPNSVTAIDEMAFFECRGLRNLNFGNGVAIIGKEAFGRCSSLTSLTIPNSVKTIKDAAFEECTGLTGELIIPNSVTHLGEAAFVDCSGLTSATILSPIKMIDAVFWGCSGLTSVTLPNTITCLGESAFEGCFSLTSFSIPNAVDSILYSAFKDCTGLKSIVIPNSVTLIDDEAFWNCSRLESLTIGRSVETIRHEAFGGCTSLTSIVVADDNPVFDSRDNCNGIIETASNTLNTGCKTTIIPNSVTTIGNSAFEGISSMTSVTIPSSVTYIETDAFCDCFGLTSVICKATTPPTMEDVYVFDYYDNYNTYAKTTLYVPAASLQAYKTTNYWNKFSRILPIEDYATPMPTITSELSIGAMTVAASGVGTVVLMVDGVVVDNPCDIPRTEHEQAVTVTATAQEDGKLVSDVATLRLTIPAILPLSTDNYLSMHDTTVVRGATVKIPVRMTNAATIVSFQTDISLPDGLEVALEDGDYLIEPSDRMTRTHALSSNQLSNGDIRVLCYSSNYKAFTGNSGDILFYIAVRGTATIEGDCVITLKNTLFTDRDFEELRAPDASATVHVLPFLLGDANGSGTVTVTDVVVTAQRVLELDPQPFIFEGADVNEDGIISVTDVTRIAYMVLNEAIPRAPLRSPILWNNGDRLSADAISLAAGETRTVALKLDNALSYTAMQLDLNLPEGLTATNFRLAERATDLALDLNTVGNGSTRVMCYSPALAAIKGDEGVLLTFDVTATDDVEGSITVNGIELVTTDCQTVMLDSFSIGVNDATSVNVLNDTKAIADIEYFNLAGQRMDKPENGVTLVVTTYTDGTRTTTKVIK